MNSELAADRNMDSWIIGISEMVAECFDENCGENSNKAVSPVTLKNAIKFAKTLPEYLQLPEYIPDDDGEICLEWKKEEKYLSISIGVGTNCNFSYNDGTINGHGVFRFQDEIPQMIIDILVIIQ